MTLIDTKFKKVDTWFPRLNDEWIPVKNVKNKADENNPYTHYFLTYERIVK